LVVAEAVAAVEVADAVGAVIGRRQPDRPRLGRPGRAEAGPDRQRAELVEGETPVPEPADDLLDPVQLAVLIRVARLLPGPGALKGDLVGVQDLPQPLTADPDDPLVVAAQIGGEFAPTPVRERAPERLGPGLGRRDDEPDIVVTDAAGTAARPPRVQRGQPPLVERAWITSRTVSSSAATSRAIARTGVPDDEARMIVARRTRIDSCRPRRTIRPSRCPSSSVKRRARTGSAIASS